MSRDKSKKDTISEDEYNEEMVGQSTEPETDSPGDSEEDAGSEFLMGLNYMGSAEPGDIDFKGNPSPEDRANSNLPKNARVVSSDLPSPSADADRPSDTH